MSRTVFCLKLKQSLPGMQTPPFPGDLGAQIYQDISQQAWDMWLSHQTMLINEYRLSMIDAKARAFLRTEMRDYFFGSGGSEKPKGYIPPEDNHVA